MLIVQIVGGLGNQMYGYALYRTLLERGRDVYMDISFYDHQNSSSDVAIRKYELSDVFNITERIIKLTPAKKFIAKLFRKFHYKVYREKGSYYQPEVFDIKSGFLYGYWQSFKYFSDIDDIIRNEFTFKKIPTGEHAKLLDEVSNCNSVSISVRRGDYLKLSSFNILKADYYRNSMRYIQERVPNAKFFCVSDDIEYCKNNFSGMGIKFVNSPEDNDAYDMQLISLCKHNIVANSTFSVWGAYLNQNPEKIVLYPDKVFADESHKLQPKDFWPDDWIEMPS